MAWTDFINTDRATLVTLRDKVLADMGRQLVGGETWNKPGGGGRTGVDFKELKETLGDIEAAIAFIDGNFTDEVVADLSAPPL